jgi:hypothetical protein
MKYNNTQKITMSYRLVDCLASGHEMELVATVCIPDAVYSLELLMMDGKTIRNM